MKKKGLTNKMKEDINKELIKWYQTRYLNPNIYHLMDDPKVMRMSGIEFILERNF